MHIVLGIENVNLSQYNEFLAQSSDATIFHTIEMQHSFSFDPLYKPEIAICIDQDEIVGALTWVVRKEYSGLLGPLTARSISWGGPLVPNHDNRVLSQLLETYIKSVKSVTVFSEFRNLFDLSWAWPDFERHGFTCEPHMNYLIDLSMSQDQLMKAMSQSRRKMLRRVINKGDLQVREVFSEKEIEQFYQLVQLTYQKVRKPYPSLSHFVGAKRVMGDAAGCFICYKDSVPIASRFVLCNNSVVYDWYAGSDPDHNHLNPNEFIVWEILKWAKDRGHNIFDFGGGGDPSKPYGPREFKRRFGGREVFFDRFVLVHKPFIMKLAKVGFSIRQKTGFR